MQQVYGLDGRRQHKCKCWLVFQKRVGERRGEGLGKHGVFSFNRDWVCGGEKESVVRQQRRELSLREERAESGV